jgi:lipopolysaccharide biosynthesis protein
MNKRAIALYLPQYHPVPENDAWWGKGCTEWTNVTKAKPLFKGHYQPHLPADLGFYDLRLPEVREQQAKLAKENGISGFCYYHYWFNGRRILERPFEEILGSGKPDFPFMLCWANENWTRRWDGLDKEILLQQNYSDEDDISFMQNMMRYFKDPRYIRVDNKPVFVLYKHFLLPDATATANRWRQVAKEHGLELYLCHMVFDYSPSKNYLVPGFDAAIDFEPFGIRRIQINHSDKASKPFTTRIAEKLLALVNKNKRQLRSLPVRDYRSMYDNIRPLKETGYKIYPSLVPGWDNTARRQKNPLLILNDNTPDNFKDWLVKVEKDFQPYSVEENFIFINAWNEWAEGNHLEPCQRWGLQYLEKVKSVFKS